MQSKSSLSYQYHNISSSTSLISSLFEPSPNANTTRLHKERNSIYLIITSILPCSSLCNNFHIFRCGHAIFVAHRVAFLLFLSLQFCHVLEARPRPQIILFFSSSISNGVRSIYLGLGFGPGRFIKARFLICQAGSLRKTHHAHSQNFGAQ
jgi:hypothetical protein